MSNVLKMIVTALIVLSICVISCTQSQETKTSSNISLSSESNNSTVILRNEINPTHSLPNTGAIKGSLLYTDNTTPNQVSIYIFRSGETESTDVAFVNDNGDYCFSDLPIGTYEIYAAIYKDYSLTISDVTVVVKDQEIMNIPTIIVPKEMVIMGLALALVIYGYIWAIREVRRFKSIFKNLETLNTQIKNIKERVEIIDKQLSGE